MADTFKFELVSPERLLMSEDVTQVVIPGTEGQMTIMRDHAPVMTTIRPGIILVTMTDGKPEPYVIFGGFADILPNGCTVLAESAVHLDDANREELQARIEEARNKMNEAGDEREKADLAQYLSQLTTLEHAMAPGAHLV